ncbi:MAG TPA: prepilin-type N-terminal cleavage/methylation domain-containing protein [Verrucomicrobiae bacterium]|nr:prepilin-type N-terminal cleavage/methylation domain-containing protein [Verrucomicrobiae bacterium]
MRNLQLLKNSAERRRAFTLPEALIAVTLFSLLMGGLVSANLFGMRMFQMSQSKLSANDSARKALGLLADEIRKSQNLWVGNLTNGSFVGVLDGEPQIGSALMIQATTNATNYVVYFMNPGDQTLRRLANATGNTTLIANTVTNSDIFSAQDFQGNVLTNSQSDRVIHATLDLVTPQPWLPYGEYSKLETSVTRRLNN